MKLKESSLVRLSSVSAAESVSMGTEKVQSFCIVLLCPGWAHIYLTEGGGTDTPLGGAVRPSSPLTVAIIKFWKVFIKTASAMWTGTRSEEEVRVGPAVAPPKAGGGGGGVGEQQDVSAGR